MRYDKKYFDATLWFENYFDWNNKKFSNTKIFKYPWHTIWSSIPQHGRRLRAGWCCIWVWYSECCRNHGCAYVPRLISFLTVQGQRLLSCRYNSLNALITDTANNVLSGSETQYICNEFMEFTFSVCGLYFSLMQRWVLNLLFDFKGISVLSHWKII